MGMSLELQSDINGSVGVNLTDNATYVVDQDESMPLHILIPRYVVPIVFAIIFIVGVVGNITLIFIVLKNKNMRTTPNIFIVSLALGDLLLILVSVPFYAISYTVFDWRYGLFLCKLNGFLKALSMGVSVFTLTALSADRYMAIRYPMRRHLESPFPRTPLIAGGIWLLSMGFAMFEGTIIHVSVRYHVRVCHSHPEHYGDWFPCFRAWLRFTVYFLVPVLIIGILYSLMASSLWQSDLGAGDAPPLTGSGQSAAALRQAKARKKIAKLVLAIVGLFVACWLPQHIYFLWFQCPSYGEYNLFWHIWKIVSYCLSFFNSCINPLVLYILSDQFRVYTNRYLFCGWCRDKDGGRTGASAWQSTVSDYKTSRVTSDKTTESFI